MTRPMCVECSRRWAVPNRQHCQQCRDDYVDALKRRRAAERRVQPIGDFL